MTIPKECKRLAEVDFPIAEVSKHAVREKSIRHGHPSTLHLWWARRPLASCRAMLMALLLPDPVDEHCPAAFREDARRILLAMSSRPRGWDELLATEAGLRKGLLHFIADFANWDNAADPIYLATARALVQAAHPDETPLVVDPFAGGGSIPLEALRIGCDAFASDLNPVAVLINKVMLEDIPRYGNKKIKVTNAAGEEVEANGLAEALRIAGAAVKAAAEKELAEFYPPDPDGSRPIAYIWARTVRCESPNCGAEIPLVRSLWLVHKGHRKRALKFDVIRKQGAPPQLDFSIFEPKSELEVSSGTVSQARATCPCCNMVLAPERVRAQLNKQRGGADVVFDENGKRTGGARLLAVLVSGPNEQGRRYRESDTKDYASIWCAHLKLTQMANVMSPNAHQQLLTEPIPTTELRRISIPLYGCTRWADIFTTRQTLSLLTILNQALTVSSHLQLPVRNAIQDLLALSVSKQAEQLTSFVSWIKQREVTRGTFSRQALGFVWDFVELVPIVEAQEYSQIIDAMVEVTGAFESLSHGGQAQLADACHPPLPKQSAHIWFTDPPYYDSVPYSHLSDLFYVWLKRGVSDSVKHLFSSELTSKDSECVVDRPHKLNPMAKTVDFYERKMSDAMTAGRELLVDDGIGSVVFAHKTTEGWESLISGMLNGGFTISASWPIQTERNVRLNSLNQAALATSVHLVCRPRHVDAGTGDWGRVHSGLPNHLQAWMHRLEAEGIRGADLVFACIGPALELYSQYSQVVDAEDRPIPLGGDPTASEPHRRGYLAYVWETVARLALEQVLGSAEATARNGAAGALEEDARLTALFLWTLQTSEEEAPPPNGANGAAGDEESDEEDDEAPRTKRKAGMSLPFDVARRFAQPLGIHLPAWERRIIETEKGVVRLLPVGERAGQLFGEGGADAVAGELERSPVSARNLQLSLFGELEPPTAPTVRGRRRRTANVADEDLRARREATTLDRVHAAMLLQKSGRTNALRALLAAEQERGPMFLRLANALSGLYPKSSEEKRLVDAMLLAYPK